MKLNTHILSSELEFRNYIQKDIENIIKIIIFEDILDKTIFFYCFMNNNTIIATKESTLNNFSSYFSKIKRWIATPSSRNDCSYSVIVSNSSSPR